MSKPKHFRFTNHCKFCFHSKITREYFQTIENLRCTKHNFDIHAYDATSRVCDDYQEEMEEE